ncbi:hypothetical protein ABT117_31470, partial [Streptomyces sp. NPDC002262]|uniref:hypothetical protein n=1 Tax=Streptomyces sp. NPDC002262 TaxID=3154414 RepID=UPI0033304597
MTARLKDESVHRNVLGFALPGNLAHAGWGAASLVELHVVDHLRDSSYELVHGRRWDVEPRMVDHGWVVGNASRAVII